MNLPVAIFLEVVMLLEEQAKFIDFINYCSDLCCILDYSRYLIYPLWSKIPKDNVVSGSVSSETQHPAKSKRDLGLRPLWQAHVKMIELLAVHFSKKGRRYVHSYQCKEMKFLHIKTMYLR